MSTLTLARAAALYRYRASHRSVAYDRTNQDPPPSPPPNPPPGGPDAITLGAMTAFPVSRAAAIETLYIGDDNQSAVATAQFKVHTDPDQPWNETTRQGWRDCLPLERNASANDGGDLPDGKRGFYHSVVLLQPNTAYDVKTTVVDADGGSGSVSGSFTTRADPPAIGPPDYYVDAVNGSDTNAGTTSAAAWATVAHAVYEINKGSGDVVVLFAPGDYVLEGSTLQIVVPNVTFVAQNVAVAPAHTAHGTRTWYDPQPTNLGQRSIMRSVHVLPSTSSWVQVSLTGPKTGNSYNAWKYQGTTNIYDAVHAFIYDATPDGDDFMHVADWPNTDSHPYSAGWTLTTAAGWAEVVNNNDTYNYGIYVENGSPYGVYVILPNNANPNDYYCDWDRTSSAGWGIWAHADGFRISGFEFRGISNPLTFYGENNICENCLFSGYSRGGQSIGDKVTVPPVYHLVRWNHFRHWGYGNPTTTQRVGNIPWIMVKGSVWMTDGTQVSSTKTQPQTWDQKYCPTVEMYQNSGKDGHDMGLDSEDPTGVATAALRYTSIGTILWGNHFEDFQDDGPAAGGTKIIGFCCWDNWCAKSLTSVTCSGGYGPQYYFYNDFYQTGDDQEPVGNGGDDNEPFPGPTTCKSGFLDDPYGRLHFYHNTYATSSLVSVTTTVKGLYVGRGTYAFYPNGGGDASVFRVRNCVSFVTGYPGYFPAPLTNVNGGSPYTEDHNEWQTTSPVSGHQVFVYSQNPYSSLAAYQAATGQGAGNNPVGGDSYTVDLTAQFVDMANGNLDYVAGCKWLGAGVKIGNISDVPLPPGVHPCDGGGGYQGSAPNLGAFVVV